MLEEGSFFQLTTRAWGKSAGIEHQRVREQRKKSRHFTASVLQRRLHLLQIMHADKLVRKM
jgi:hypothetical protein